ncbi:MAG: N-acetyl-gamma-glutamyl-phosphate reductase [Leptospirales bacterium]
MSIKIGILGAAGFTGRELLKTFKNHSKAKVEYITSSAHSRKRMVEVFPELQCQKYDELEFSPHPNVKGDLPHLDVLFLAVPDGVAMYWGLELALEKVKIIDISGAFRLNNEDDFKKYYRMKHNAHELVENFVYGMPEMRREEISHARRVANPGCYATSAILPLYCIKDHLKLFSEKVIVDAKSGTSGAGGRKENDALPYSDVYENFKAYKVEAHQHIPEIVQEVRPYLDIKLKMTPHLLPMFRGILTCIYLTAKKNSNINVDEIRKSLKEAARKEPFIRYRENPEEITLKKVQLTNFIDISLDYDPDSGILVIVSAIDNLVKGAAGVAVQNMNLMFNCPETTGLL